MAGYSRLYKELILNYQSIIPCSTSDFYGISVVIAVSGCIHKCKGCWAKAQGGWKFDSGKKFTEDTLEYLTTLLSHSYIDNLVIQGGDGLVPRNLAETTSLCKKIKEILPEKRIVVFTGYVYDDIITLPEYEGVFSVIDVLVDGRYEKDLPSAPFRGSSNQRIIDVKKSIDTGEVVLF